MRALNLLPDDHPRDLRTSLYLVSDFFFFSGRMKPKVLLPPHLLELDGLLTRLQRDETMNLGRRSAEALVEVEALDNDKLAAMTERVNSLGAQPDSNVLRGIIEFFEDNAPSLVALLNAEPSAPRSRLRQLLKAASFGQLEDLDLKVSVDEEVIARWQPLLTTARIEAGRPRESAEPASFRDAFAMGLVAAANQQLLPKSKLVLVTQSAFMHQVMRGEARQSTWRRAGNVLRHPRGFVPLLAFEDQPPDENRRRLDNTSRAIDGFLVAYQQVRPTLTTDPDAVVDSELWKTLEAIRHQWRSSVSLGSLVALHPVGREPGLLHGRDYVQKLFQLASQREALINAIRVRLDRLATEIDEELSLLAATMRAQGGSLPGTLEERRESLPQQRLIIEGNLQQLPITIQFYEPKIRDLWHSLTQRRDLTPKDLVAVLRQGFEDRTGYEARLLVACRYAVADEWRLAESYADQAIRNRTNEEPLPHEARFLLAVCKRMPGDRQRIREAIALIDAAQREKATSREPGYEDPRYLKEKGTLILWWNRLTPEDGSGDAPPSPEEGVALLERALERAGGDADLIAQIHNNLCYHYLLSASAGAAIRARHHLQLLIEAQTLVTSDRDLWPAPHIDTVVWAEWLLARGHVEAARRRALVALLERALTRTSRQNLAWAGISAHLDEIRQSLVAQP